MSIVFAVFAFLMFIFSIVGCVLMAKRKTEMEKMHPNTYKSLLITSILFSILLCSFCIVGILSSVDIRNSLLDDKSSAKSTIIGLTNHLRQLQNTTKDFLGKQRSNLETVYSNINQLENYTLNLNNVSDNITLECSNIDYNINKLQQNTSIVSLIGDQLIQAKEMTNKINSINNQVQPNIDAALAIFNDVKKELDQALGISVNLTIPGFDKAEKEIANAFKIIQKYDDIRLGVFIATFLLPIMLVFLVSLCGGIGKSYGCCKCGIILTFILLIWFFIFLAIIFGISEINGDVCVTYTDLKRSNFSSIIKDENISEIVGVCINGNGSLIDTLEYNVSGFIDNVRAKLNEFDKNFKALVNQTHEIKKINITFDDKGILSQSL